ERPGASTARRGGAPRLRQLRHGARGPLLPRLRAGARARRGHHPRPGGRRGGRGAVAGRPLRAHLSHAPLSPWRAHARVPGGAPGGVLRPVPPVPAGERRAPGAGGGDRRHLVLLLHGIGLGRAVGEDGRAPAAADVRAAPRVRGAPQPAPAPAQDVRGALRVRAPLPHGGVHRLHRPHPACAAHHTPLRVARAGGGAGHRGAALPDPLPVPCPARGLRRHPAGDGLEDGGAGGGLRRRAAPGAGWVDARAEVSV
ncbi:MAG: hypothetical protein AVDCRST_MAG89-3800, partial [uncultured Gemmatimonadetes bacterium]